MTYGGSWALSAETLNLSITIDLVVLEHSQLGLLARVLDLLWRSVNLLLALLGAASEAKDEMEGRLFLDVVVGEGTAVFELLASEDQALLVGRNTFLVLDLSLDVIDSVRRLDLQSDGLAGESLNKNLHASTKTEDKVKSRLLLDIVIRQRPPILELFASKDQTLLIRGDAELKIR